MLLLLPLVGWAQAPTLSGFSPASGVVGSTLTLTGSNLTGTRSVRFGEVPARFTVVSGTQVTVTVPTLASTSKLRVTTAGGTVLSSTAFHVTRTTATYQYVLASTSFSGIGAGTKSAPAFADLDADGRLDLLVGNADGRLYHYEQSAVSSLTFALVSNNFAGIDVGNNAVPAFTDLDGDGRLDLIIGESGGNLRYYEQNSVNSTGFTNIIFSPFGGVGPGAAPTMTDLNGNGLIDVVTGTSAGSLYHYEQSQANTTTTFTNYIQEFNMFSAINAGLSTAPVFVDLDGDQKLDLLIGESGGAVRHYEQTTANGSSWALVSNSLLSSAIAAGFAKPAVTDLDGDGLLDLLVGNGDGTLYHYEQYAGPSALALSSNTLQENVPANSIVGTFTTTDPSVGDSFTYSLVAGAGSTDNTAFTILTNRLRITASPDHEAKSSYSVRVRTTDAAGNFFEDDFTITITDVVEAPAITGFSPASGEVGSTLTLTGTDLTSVHSVRFGEVPARFTVVSGSELTVTVPRLASSQRVRVNNSVSTALSPAVFSVTRYSNSTLCNAVSSSLSGLDAGLYSAPTVTDLDADGLLDVLVGNYAGNVLRYEQTAVNSLTFTAANTLTANNSVSNPGIFVAIDVGDYAAPGITDLDGDGRLDLLVGGTGASLYHYEQTSVGAATFTRVTTTFLTLAVGTTRLVPTFTDLDQDGLLDLLVGISSTITANSGRIQHYEQNAANGTAFTLRTTSTGFNNISVSSNAAPVFADLDGNGRLDLLVGRSSGVLDHYQQNAAGSLSFTLVGAGFNGIDAGSYSNPALTDLDGDGLFDLAVGNSGGTLAHHEQDDPRPSVTSFSPSSGPAGSFITITGTHLTGATAITFAGTTDHTVTSGFTVASATSITGIEVPGGAQTGALTVTTPIGTTVASSQAFTVTAPPMPTITGFGTGSGAVGSSVVITGTSLYSTSSVRLGELLAPVTARTNTTLTVTVPRLASTHNAAVTTSVGQALSPGAFGVPRASSNFAYQSVNGNFNGIDVGELSAPAFTNLDGDGLLDLVIGNYDGTLHYYEQSALNATSFALVAATFNGIDVGGHASPTFTDLNGDGLLDLLIGASNRRIHHYRQSAVNSTAFVLVTTFFNDLSPGGYCQPTFTDLDGDGLLDLIVGIINSRMVHYEQSAPNSTTFALVSTTFNGFVGPGNFELAPTFADLNGDGLLDLLIGMYDGTVRHFRQDAVNATTFTLVTNSFGGVSLGTQYMTPTVTDLDGDGLLDLLVGGYNGTLAHYKQLPAAPLPVELVGFSASRVGETAVRLGWATATEQNSAYFEVERSLDGVAFVAIGKVEAAGMSSTRRGYGHLDAQLPGSASLLYYRLRQMDQDGTFSYSPVRVVALHGVSAALVLYPNPTAGATMLTGAEPGAGAQVLDVLGRPVLTATADAAGSVRLPAGLTPGVYLVRSGTRVSRLVVE
ncbi:FG-GAP-like repeat-containing protein [Hymenobacter sp. BT175]|uniref:FG-GAP-like repeat-containing protein n=1 Tax=Hymenobacter translucens TaxID=2886507 RepID=UPI001D0ECF95|nr:FG-GAP-like repeat-containing protein [Hymenobacter translucens]MCC2544915.1 FG-GAP-like repeat-containing protein [Hymenobacter translucens]